MNARAIVDRWKAGDGFDPAALADPAVRRAIYHVIADDGAQANHGLLRAMLPIEVAYRSGQGAEASDGGDYYNNLYTCGLLLYGVGDVTDVPAMWAAKTTDMDTGCGFDVQMLVGAGVEQTLAFLRAHGHTQAADYIAECQKTGDFDDLAGWCEYARSFYLAPAD